MEGKNLTYLKVFSIFKNKIQGSLSPTEGFQPSWNEFAQVDIKWTHKRIEIIMNCDSDYLTLIFTGNKEYITYLLIEESCYRESSMLEHPEQLEALKKVFKKYALTIDYDYKG